MDAFITEMGAEVYYNRSGWVSMLGVTNSKLNQNVQPIVPGTPTAARSACRSARSRRAGCSQP